MKRFFIKNWYIILNVLVIGAGLCAILCLRTLCHAIVNDEAFVPTIGFRVLAYSGFAMTMAFVAMWFSRRIVMAKEIKQARMSRMDHLADKQRDTQDLTDDMW